MKKTLIVSLLVSALFSVIAGGQVESNKNGLSGEYVMGGSTTLEPIVRTAIEAFEEIEPGAKLSYESQGSSVGIKGIMSSLYILGGSSRNIKSSETDKGVKATAIALDGLACVANGDIPLDSLSKDVIAQIFRGDIKNWKAVGGPDHTIVVVNRDEASGTRATFKELVVGKKSEFVYDAVIVASNGDMVTKVGATPYSIGYCGFGYLDTARNAGAKAILVDGVEPNEANVKSGLYPVSRKLWMAHLGDIEPGSFSDIFISFLLSEEGQNIVEDEGFIRF